MKKIRLYTIRILIFLFMWSLLEFFCFKFYKKIPEQYLNGKRIVEYNLGNKFDISNQSIIPHPYLLYVNSPYYIDSVKQHNSKGYRNTEFKLEKDSNTLRILCLGGSTTYGYLNRNPLSTWSAKLQDKLSKISSKKIEVINGGLNYATSAELLASYVFRHRYIKPDIIIFHEGGNDVAPVLFPKYNPEYTHFRSQGSQISLRPGEIFLLNSNVFKLIYSFWLNHSNSVYKDQPYSFSDLKKHEVYQRVHNESNYTGFKRNVDLLVKLAKIDCSKVFLMGFLNAPPKKIAESRPDLKNIVDDIVYCTEKNNNILELISITQNVNYIKINKKLFINDWFIDNCHLNPLGEEMKAKIVFDQIKKSI